MTSQTLVSSVSVSHGEINGESTTRGKERIRSHLCIWFGWSVWFLSCDDDTFVLVIMFVCVWFQVDVGSHGHCVGCHQL